MSPSPSGVTYCDCACKGIAVKKNPRIASIMPTALTENFFPAQSRETLGSTME